MPKRKSQPVDARASKNVKMAEPEVTFHQAEETDVMHSCA